ncbi:hypothetical protein [Limosilactobacillus avium]|uniref:hypothetical protein n=1 Tax=Limosilactobacillus avium TaxID=2991831 RepID=UPI0024BBE865|nr:hypothetical protein [Limosilactobacillus avium]
MKKISLICVSILLCGTLSGCGNRNQQKEDSESSKISKLKAENSRLKAKKSSKHKRKENKASQDSQSAKSVPVVKTGTKASSSKSTAKDSKEEQAAKAMHDYDPEWWDNSSPEEQQYWAHHTAYGSNEDFMYAPGLYEWHLIQQPSSSPSNSTDYGSYNVNDNINATSGGTDGQEAQ